LKLRNKRILVTGGAGFIGSHLVDRVLEENPARIAVVDNFFLGREENLTEAKSKSGEVKIYRLDASDLSAMEEVVRREAIDVVFDLAVIPLLTSLDYPAWTMKTNVQIATVFAELARVGAIATLIHCSSSEAYGTAVTVPMKEEHALMPTTPYAASKAAADYLLASYRLTYGIDIAIARPFNNFGPRQNPRTYAGIIPIVIQNVRGNLPITIFGDGQQTRDFIFVRDTADAILRVYESPETRGKVINIATGIEISINDLVKKLLGVMGAPDHKIIHADPRPGDVRRHQADITLAKKLIGFSSYGVTDEQLQETITWYTDKKV
jgi:UDP-glucose 4-epimerase